LEEQSSGVVQDKARQSQTKPGNCRMLTATSPPLGIAASALRSSNLFNLNTISETNIFKMKAIFAVPITAAMIYRAWSHQSLTPAGIVAATLTAIAHAYHPWNLPFALLIVFFLAGTRVTKVEQAFLYRIVASDNQTG
jgi:hypothetical protein